MDPVTGEAVSLFHPIQDSWSEHFQWSPDGSVIEPLTQVARATIEALKINRPQMVRMRTIWVTLGEHPPDDE
jgi:hypothetical protein